KESLQVARDHALEVRWHRPELPEVRRADVVQPRGVQTEHVPLVGFADLRVVPLLSYLLRNLEPPERLDLPLRGTIPEGIGAEVLSTIDPHALRDTPAGSSPVLIAISPLAGLAIRSKRHVSRSLRPRI